jgi:copper chaperone CopZ
MKKLLTLALTIMLVATLVQVPLAGEGCTAAKSADNAKASMINGKGACSAADAAACAAKMGMPPEECQKLCASGDYTMVSISIEGMTCTGCENSISAALKELPGVVHVGQVSHKEGRAYVLVDSKKATNTNLVSAVTGKGYKAEVIPAVATTTVNQTDAKAGCATSATQSCAKTCATPCGAAKTETKAKTDKTDGTM